MILHTDIPTRAHIDRLLLSRDPASVSIYVPTDPTSSNTRPRTALRSLGERALQQLRTGGIDASRVAAIEEDLADLLDDQPFWRYQARTLAVLLTPELLQTFRLPNRLLTNLEVSDRFYVKPLLRAVTFPQVAFVLALAQNSVRVVEVSADDEPTEVSVPDLPSDAASVAGRASLADRAPARRIQGDEGHKVRLRQYARHIDLALRPLLNGLDVPLILAAAEPLDSILRSVCTYPHLAPNSIPGNPESASDAELGARAREILDSLYAAELRRIHRMFEERRAQDRGLVDIGDVARAAAARVLALRAQIG